MPSLLSEVCAVLTDLHCNVVNAELWTRNARVVSVVHVTNDTPEDRNRLAIIKEMLCNVLKGNNDLKTAKLTLSSLNICSSITMCKGNGSTIRLKSRMKRTFFLDQLVGALTKPLVRHPFLGLRSKKHISFVEYYGIIFTYLGFSLNEIFDHEPKNY
ncbi:ACT domain-containing protein [Forsythia ovata]|uniref:ACT domain-containing protein ACR n=1 Tax=Forsythia ovata TaxID=205694 RepID=A0ABD1T3X5_9LAMI